LNVTAVAGKKLKSVRGFGKRELVMADPARAMKMADRIKVIVAKRLERGIRDPRLGFVTITDVKVTGDLQHASVFYTVYGSEEERRDSAAALKAATGMFRSEVGKNITARLTPSIEFIADAIPENAALIDDLLREARERDTEVEQLARTATYAGDEDPYVKPREFGEDEDEDEHEEPASAAEPSAEDASK
jgi:ribosome-binding factor A